MKILTVEQIRALDTYTIDHEPIAPIDLMERASLAFCDWFEAKFDKPTRIKVLCGMGNNGGDGLAIARILIGRGYQVEVWVVRHLERQKDDFTHNFKRLQLHTQIRFIERETQIPKIAVTDTVIDAMLGSGISRPMGGITKAVAERLNMSKATIVSVDIASGLFADHANAPDDSIVQPTYTVSFQLPKFAFFQPQLADYVGEWHLVPIGLDKRFIERASTFHFYTTSADIEDITPKRPKYAHKGSFGRALLVVGSYGMIGAAVLAAKACLRSGVGLLEAHIPRCGYEIMQSCVPEALCSTAFDRDFISTRFFAENLQNYSAIGIGPGLGQSDKTREMIESLLKAAGSIPLVLDADALNNLSTKKGRELLQLLPANTILTPHPKEFERLIGKKWQNDYEKLNLLKDFCSKHHVIVVLKGAHTVVCTPNRELYFNSTGNPGMATGGSGDVLTGIITALLAQGYSPKEAAIFGVYQHGLAGDRVAVKRGQAALIASDLIEELRW
ncbi:MAG: NAD(P)H-hydrate dehydratase [Spirosomataceae bacterium]